MKKIFDMQLFDLEDRRQKNQVWLKVQNNNERGTGYEMNQVRDKEKQMKMGDSIYKVYGSRCCTLFLGCFR